jgi:asparagine synthase (glutamine-hydrolysing)
MRASLTHILTRLMSDAQASSSVRAAGLGLELTRPFHDKRVVELALAIPEQLYIKNGRNRRIARAALRQLLPPEYQVRTGRNSALDPDLSSMIDRALPALEAEIQRLEQRPTPRRYVDLARVRLLLEQRRSTPQGAENAARWALHGLLVARYLDWFSQENAGPE